MNNWIIVAQLSVTVINEIIDIMKEKQKGGNSMKINRYITRVNGKYSTRPSNLTLAHGRKKR